MSYYNRISVVYFVRLMELIKRYLTQSYETSIAKFKAMALMTVGVAPLHRAKNPSSLVILLNASITLLQFLLSAGGSLASACIRMRARSAGFPTSEPTKPAMSAQQAFWKNDRSSALGHNSTSIYYFILLFGIVSDGFVNSEPSGGVENLSGQSRVKSKIVKQ